jgi:membrane protease YdiL (CAAX protease family)
MYYLFYNGIYGIVLSTIIPLYFLYKNKMGLAEVGIKRLYLKQWIVLACFVVFSIGGQMIPLIQNGIEIQLHLLSICLFPLIMTTFFEEFLFRGFIQTKIEKEFGAIIAILVSGLLFSLYHIGYPGFRTLSDLLILFAVGIGFALAYKLSHNNFFVAYFVNLPNALLTYILKSEQFPVLTLNSTIFAIITIIIVILIIIISNLKVNIKQKTST